MKIAFWFCIGLTTTIYFGYPIAIYIIARIWGREPKTDDITPYVSIIIAAHNEEKVIKEKAENVLALDYPADKLEILFALDGCSDGTRRILSQYRDNRIRVLDKNEREGKVRTLNRVVPFASGEIVVFSDANTIHEREFLRKLVRNFADSDVGLVCGRLRYKDTGSSTVGKGENLYWKYEHFIKLQESRLGTLLVTNGSVQAIRKELYPFPDSDVADDFSVPLLIQAKGYKLIFEPEAIVYEKATQSIKEEFEQKVRIIAQGIKGTMKLKQELLRLRPLGMLEFLFHKSLRWFVSFYLMIAFIVNLFLLNEAFYLVLFAAQITFYALALVGFFLRHTSRIRIFYIPFYFCLVNLSSVVALFRAIKGDQTRMWEKAHSTRTWKTDVESLVTSHQSQVTRKKDGKRI